MYCNFRQRQQLSGSEINSVPKSCPMNPRRSESTYSVAALPFRILCRATNSVKKLPVSLDSMHWFSNRRSPSPRAATQWYRMLLLVAYVLRRAPYYALSMGMTQQFFVFCPWWPWPLIFNSQIRIRARFFYSACCSTSVQCLLVCVSVCVCMFLSVCYYCFLLIVVFIYSAL